MFIYCYKEELARELHFRGFKEIKEIKDTDKPMWIFANNSSLVLPRVKNEKDMFFSDRMFF